MRNAQAPLRIARVTAVITNPVVTPMIGATSSHFWMSREYVALRSSCTSAVYLRISGWLNHRDAIKVRNDSLTRALVSQSWNAFLTIAARCRDIDSTVSDPRRGELQP